MDINSIWSDIDLSKYKQNTRCLAVNTILAGKYLVGPVLGQGGFGITYMGYDLNMETKIAIKEYFPVELVSRDTTTMHGDRVLSLSGEKSITYQQGLKKYVTEAQNVSQFSEVPGVVSVKDFFYENETAYIVMEYIEGVSLKDYLKEKGGRLSEEETLAIMKPVLEALVKVHKVGIIHRDISPDNIMLTFEDAAKETSLSADKKIKSVKLIDFGAARMTAKSDQKSLTIILKHGYAPEEQYRTHGEQGPWTDVYALCAVMYRMLTRETPVPAMDRMFKDELKCFDSLGLKGVVSENTAAAILKGLAVKKNERIQSVQELISVLYDGAKVCDAENGKKRRAIIAAVSCISAIALLAIILIVSGMIYYSRADSLGGIAGDNSEQSGKSDMVGEFATSDNTSVENMVDFNTEEALGEQIAFYHPHNSVDTDYQHTLICKPDGTVEARGDNTLGQCDVQDWDHMVSVKTGSQHSLGLRADGIVKAAGSNSYGQCEVEGWTNIVQIATDDEISLGVTGEGTILMAGSTRNFKFEPEKLTEWTDIKRIAFGGASEPGTIAGLKYDGTVVFEGMDVQVQIEDWENVTEIFFFSMVELIGIEEDGTVRAVRLDGTDDLPPVFDNMPKMQQFSKDSLGVSVDGKIANLFRPYEELKTWTDLIAVEYVEGDYYIGLKEDGTILEYMGSAKNASLEEFQKLEWVQLIPSHYRGPASILARTKAGKTLYYGSGWYLDELYEGLNETDEIVQAADGFLVMSDGTVRTTFEESVLSGVKGITQSYAYLMEDGTVGKTNQFEENYSWIENIDNWKNLVQLCGDRNLWGLTSDGAVLSDDETEPVTIGIKQIYASDAGCLGLREDGTVEVLAFSSAAEERGAFMVDSWENITQIAMGKTHSVGLKADGTVVATGSNHTGQCDVEEWKDVIYIDACDQCTVGITKKGDLLIAGSLY